MPILLRAFFCRKVGHHDHIQAGTKRMSFFIRYHVFVDEKLAVAFRQGRLEVREYLEGFGIWPVVQDGVHVIGSRS